MSYNLFLDDERHPKDVKWVDLPPVEWRVVRTYKDFVGLITKDGLPKKISFDHDLADEHYREYTRMSKEEMVAGGPKIRYDTLREKTGYDCAKWLVDYCIEWDKDLPEYYIHTMNPVGGVNIKHVLKNYEKYREQ
jgi:hypothetical protein